MKKNKTIYDSSYRILISMLKSERKSKKKSKKITQKQLGDMLNINQPYVCKYESHIRRLDFIEVREICITLDINFSSFIKKLQEK